jgi:Pvc16 N-terminal domain
MIELFDETLRDLVAREVTNGGGVEVSFEAPTKDWSTRRSVPTLDLYLYDLREDLTRREIQWAEVRNEAGHVVGRRPPPRRYRLSYLVTAWTQRPEDEHGLLSACLASFLRHETLPPAELAGALAEQPVPVELEVALPPGPDRSLADVWTALGGELKPSLDLVALVPFVVARETKAGPPVLEAPRIQVARTDEPGTGPEAAPGARRGARRAAAATRPVAEETVAAGSADQPGRVLRLRGASGR